MSLINGLGAFGATLSAFAGEAAKDALTETPARAPLLSSTPAAANTAAANTTPPDSTPATASLAGPRMPPGVNPYTGPHAAALWQAESAIMGPESGGKANAQNPVSSAGGLFQIINPTWDSAIQKMGLPVASSDVERDVQKYQPGLNTAVMRSINTAAASALDAAGLPVTLQTLQAAHRLGPGGAAQAIKAAQANPDAPLVGNGLAADAVRGNGDIARLTVGEFLASPYQQKAAS
jgi:hypothetical protein